MTLKRCNEMQAAALHGFIEAVLYYLPQDIALWPTGIRETACSILLQQLLRNTPPKVALEQARSGAKALYFHMFGKGGTVPQIPDPQNPEESTSWLDQLYTFSLTSPLGTLINTFLHQRLPAEYAPETLPGPLPPFPTSLTDAWCQAAITNAVLAALVQKHGPVDVRIEDLPAAPMKLNLTATAERITLTVIDDEGV